MPTGLPDIAPLALLVLAAAVLYSSVGHAGASGYLAAMAICGVAPTAMKPAALVMNIVVATVGTLRWWSAGLVPWPLLAPLCVGSIPAAFAGGAIVVPGQIYRPILGGILLLAAVRLWLPGTLAGARRVPPRAGWLVIVGAFLGFVAGLTGIGGGVFLSPVLILAGWEEPRRTAGASSAFILANSVAGLFGHLSVARDVPDGTTLLAAVALAGGLYGSWLGARRFPPLVLRRVLAVVLVVAGAKLALTG